jgi:DNA-binding CsgD family transcriptional regulator
MKRLLTPKEVKAYTLCHQNFEGLSIRQAAMRMGISVNSVQDLLKDAEAKAPQLFPILDPMERAVLKLIDEHRTIEEIAAGLGVSRKVVCRIRSSLSLKGQLLKPGKTVPYSTGMDSRVAQKF